MHELAMHPSSTSHIGDAIRSSFHRILVVDDNRDAAESLAMVLSLTGDETRIAFDGFEALETAAVFKPNVMFLDLGLPKLNGYEVARKVRQSPGGDDVLLIALTGWTLETDPSCSIAAGFDEHLTKPIDYFALSHLLAGVATVETAG